MSHAGHNQGIKGNNEYEHGSSTEGESRPASGIDSYEDDFERELETELSCQFDDERIENGKFGVETGGNGIWSYRRKEQTQNQTNTNGSIQHFERENHHEQDKDNSGPIVNFFKRWTSQPSVATENSDNFFDAAEEVGYDSSHVVNPLDNMDPAERAKLEEELRNELAKTEDEIQTLKLVLNSKMKHAQDLKQKLGITVWRELRTDVEQGFKNVKESDVYLKTETVLKSATEKTSTAFGTLSASMTKKIGEVKNSPTFKSFEDAVGSAYANVKTKVTGSRSSSMPSFEEAYGSNTYARSAGATPATTPVIPEDKPLS